MSDNDQSTELMIQASGPTAARVTPKDVAAAIVGETYTILPSGRSMVCELTLFEENGFTVRGESAVVNIENFREEIGRKIARENAVNEVWQLLGFLLYTEGLTRRRAQQSEQL